MSVFKRNVTKFDKNCNLVPRRRPYPWSRFIFYCEALCIVGYASANIFDAKEKYILYLTVTNIFLLKLSGIKYISDVPFSGIVAKVLLNWI